MNGPQKRPAISNGKLDVLPPGLASVVTRPVPTGSVAIANTIGIALVACLAADTGPAPEVRIAATFSLTNSATISAISSGRPYDQRDSNTVRDVSHQNDIAGWLIGSSISSSVETEAYALLAPIYGWFTEGLAMPDLREAKALLDKLSSPLREQ